MKKVVISTIAAIAMSASSSFAADLPVKARPVVAPPPSQWDIAFGTAFLSEYILRGISQTDRKMAVQGYFELQFKANDMITLYAGMWGSNLASYIGNGEFDISGGARFSIGNFGLDVGYVYYYYPGTVPVPLGLGYASFGEFYLKPSYKLTPWLTIGGSIVGGDNFNNSGFSAIYYTGNIAVTLPQIMPAGITTTVSAEIGVQTFDGPGTTDYTTWNLGVAFNYKAITVDLRYYDTNKHGVFLAPVSLRDLGGSTFVGAIKFDTTLSQIK